MKIITVNNLHTEMIYMYKIRQNQYIDISIDVHPFMKNIYYQANWFVSCDIEETYLLIYCRF